MPKTDEQKKAEALAEQARAARRRRANDRLAAMPQASRDAIRRDATRREQAHKNAGKPRVTAVQFLEEALDAFAMQGARDAAASVRAGMAGHKAAKRPGTDTGDTAPPSPKKSPREKSTPKEKGRPKPETKDPEKGKALGDALLADAARNARGGAPALAVVTTVTVPSGEATAYCKSCDTDKPESEFWPLKRTDKSKRRHNCRDCYNKEWRDFDARRRAAATA